MGSYLDYSTSMELLFKLINSLLHLRSDIVIDSIRLLVIQLAAEKDLIVQ